MTRLSLRGNWNNQKYPPSVILQTREWVKKLNEGISNHAADKQEILAAVIDEVMQCLSYEQTAILTLEYECLFMAKEILNSLEEDKATEFATLMAGFGRFMHALLLADGVYINGYLNYVYHGLVEYDLVLMHREYLPYSFTIDEIRLCPH